MPHYETAAGRMLRTLSLDALRGFEAAARHLSFTAAAEELSLSQSAVSKQVKVVEEAIGKSVFVRGSRRLSLTSDGRRLFEGVQQTLQQLESVVEGIVQANRVSISITVTPSFASLWLIQKLPAYRTLEPAVDIRVDASDLDAALDREGFDLAIRLGRSADAPASWKPLTQERLMLVAAPSLAERARTPADLASLPLLVFHHPIERFPRMSWSHWHAHLGLAKVATQPVFQFSQYEHVVRAAVEGVGVAIGRTPLVLPMLRSGQLKVVFPEAFAEGLSYHLVFSGRSEGRPEVVRFAAWIERMLAMDTMG